MKKAILLFSAGLILLISALILVGCGSKTPTPPNPTATKLPITNSNIITTQQTTTPKVTTTSATNTTTKITQTTTQTTQTTTKVATTNQSATIALIPLSHIQGGTIQDSRKDCLMCHKYPDGMKPIPADHVNRTSEQGQTCHKLAQ